eukprot:TRINITY_DN3338_c0_g4_i1.p1 TRINITY_DN3338_c0_g4~~TRINITY_DN3338_c0_g4_i1.p1  ORF type:complete len:416 (+),score=31.14 TRINITY_DN3338_c0_g4_i1:70-1248(+)
MGSLEEPNPSSLRSMSRAAVLAIGTAYPAHVIEQSAFPDYYFRITNSDHLTDLKLKFKRICEKSMIKKRHVWLTEEIVKANDGLRAHRVPSLDFRQEIMKAEVPRLGKEAALEAIEEWGQPLSHITHLVFCNSNSAAMPGADFQLLNLLGLPSSTKRFMLYQQGCSGGATALRLAKDLAENNAGARVLVVCSEVTVIGFRGPNETDLGSLVGHALFGDGASAAIIGADPQLGSSETALFELVCASQTIIKETEGAIIAQLREVGLVFSLSHEISAHIKDNTERILKETMEPMGVSDWNSLFWVVHPGGPAIVDAVEACLGLRPEKTEATREAMSEYGNTSSAGLFFVMDVMRKRSAELGLSTAGGGLELGVLLAFGPGVTVETVVLRCPSHK